ncbi:hypothetical protein DER45DRAFT_555446 [Fusarium avenaceum]|nr:hypothetical protein DER45DRAFT_555446 [Fusarium avenaceum]
MKKYIVASSHMASLIGRLVRTLCLLLLGTFFHSRATLHWMLRVAVARKMHIIRAEGKLEPPLPPWFSGLLPARTSTRCAGPRKLFGTINHERATQGVCNTRIT